MLRHQDSEKNSSYLESSRWVGKARNFNSSDGKSLGKIYAGWEFNDIKHSLYNVLVRIWQPHPSSHIMRNSSACHMEQMLF